ncbi:MAG: hypothetical protein P4L43_16455 [Syntrophobacteraceae bacterium]|nr:hypothetical protein [Syntrophobacteraceae bacterium]
MLTTTQNYAIYQGNGSNKQFPFNFLIPPGALWVAITNNTVNPPATTWLSQSQYSVVGLGSSSGGTVTYPLSGNSLPGGWAITILRSVPYVQDTQLANQGGLWPGVVEDALDYLTMLTQQLYTSYQQLQGEVSDLVIPSSNIMTMQQFSANTCTQSLASLASVYKTANTQATTITGFSNLIGGHHFKVIIEDAYTTIAFSTWWAGLPSGSIIGHQGQTVTFAEGDVLDCVSDGVYVYAIDSEPMVPAIVAPPSAMTIYAANTTLTLVAGSITMANMLGTRLCQTWSAGLNNVLPFFVNATNPGAGGIDTGSLAANTWYYIWAIGNGTNVNFILSTQSVWSSVAKTYISGYTYARLVGCALTNASSVFVSSRQFGNKFLFAPPTSVALASQSGYTAVTVAPFPPIAVTGLFTISFLSSSGTGSFSFSADGTNDYLVLYAIAGYSTGQGQFELPFFTPGAFWYKNSNVSGTPGVGVRGFMLNL